MLSYLNEYSMEIKEKPGWDYGHEILSWKKKKPTEFEIKYDG